MRARRVITFLLAITAFQAPADAEQLPFRHYVTADGLLASGVRAIYQDRMGYLWFATAEGLSRFDGYSGTTALTMGSELQASTLLQKTATETSGSGRMEPASPDSGTARSTPIHEDRVRRTPRPSS